MKVNCYDGPVYFCTCEQVHLTALGEKMGALTEEIVLKLRLEGWVF